MSDRIALMYHGKVQQIGHPLELYRHPRNKFTAGFIGTPTIHFVEGCELVREGGGLTVKGPFFPFQLPEKKAAGLERNVGRKIIFGIRPENLSSTESDWDGAIQARISILESIGPSIIIYAQAGDHKIQAVVPADFEPISDEYICLKFQPGHVHLFDQETEASLL